MRKRRRTKVQPSQRNRKKRLAKRLPKEEYTPGSYNYAIRRACEKYEIPHWHPHQLRHLAATELRKAFGIEVARCVLGHRSAAMTEIYSEFDAAKARDVVGKIG